jgi:flagellar basal-body rod modification protein FlgD
MSILGLTTPTLTSSTSTTKTDTASLSSNYSMFMNLLVTQMKNQDPMNPMDTSTFTSQLVQYSSVEQQIKMNSNLADLKSLLTTQNATNLVGYVGKTVTADGATNTFDGSNSTSWNFTSSAAAATAKITITNSSGQAVYSTTQSLSKGSNSFAWDGSTTSGGTAEAGSYTISVSGTDSSGSAITATTAVSGTVTAIDFSGTTPMITVGGQQISVYDVSSVSSGS